ncbi:MAG: restriction modification system specificity domain [Cellvibrio sp.]|nr:restriction modification system specificity domain [Cellvibrio sp.]
MTLQDAGVSLIDCDHRTPPHAESGYAYIAIPQLKDGHIRLDGVRLISEVDYFEWTKKLKPEEDDVIVVRRCNSGDSAVVPANFKCAIGQNLVVLRASGEIVDKKFLRWLIRSPDWWEQVNKFINVGAVFDSLKCREIPQFELPIPPMYIQKEIALILGAIDNRIQLLRETNTTLESIAQALFKSWFVDFDPVHANAGTQAPSLPPEIQSLFPSTFVESPLGLVPEGWSISTLGEICNFYGGRIQTGPFGSQLHAADYIAEGIPVVMPKDIVNRRVDTSSVAQIDTQNVERLSRHKLLAGDILFSRRGDVEKHALIGHLEEGWICGTGCLLVRPGSLTVSGFLSLALNQSVAKKWLTQHAVGATMPNLNTGILSNIPIIFPSAAVLENFQHLIDSFESNISSNNYSAQILCDLRDTLLPRLISGQLRLPEVEEILQ